MQTIRHFALPLGLAAALATSIALAQPAPGYTGPSAAPAPTQAPGQASGYTGPSSVQLMTVKQLLDTGKDDQPGYVAVDGVVYDVTNVEACKDGEHQMGLTAGNELSEEINSSPHGKQVLEGLPIVGEFVE